MQIYFASSFGATTTPPQWDVFMKVRTSTLSLCRRILYESLSAEMMLRFVSIIDPEYDFHERSGIPENYPITNQMAAERIVKDICAEGRILALVELLIRINCDGFMGREYPIKFLRDLVRELGIDGYAFDTSTGLFFEKSTDRVSPNWGRLVEGEEKQMSVLRLDIVENSLLVKRNPKKDVDKAYSDLRAIAQRAIVSRAGRIWSWEGDGVLAAFLFGQRELAAILAGMEILNELFFYNKTDNPLSSPMRVRIAAHTGPIRYSANSLELLKNETLKEVIAIESDSTPADALSASLNIFLSIDRVIQDCFGPELRVADNKVRQYSICVEGQP